MKISIFKIAVVALLATIIIIQLTSNDVRRYELNESDAYIFDNKTGKIYSTKYGTIDFIESVRKKDKKLEKIKDSI